MAKKCSQLFQDLNYTCGLWLPTTGSRGRCMADAMVRRSLVMSSEDDPKKQICFARRTALSAALLVHHLNDACL